MGLICFVLWMGCVGLFAEELLSGELSGKFSISASGAYIHFSQGNLYKNANNKRWYFSDNQYDYIGADNISGSVFGTKADLFGFSATGTIEPGVIPTYNDGYITSDDPNHYNGDFVDWGHRPIWNSDTTANTWSTLSKSEWDYILTKRTKAAQLQKIVTVNGTKGLLLLPDNATASISDTYTKEAFATFATSSGAVFLPFAGRREGTTVDKVNEEGYYWTSTTNGNLNAYMLHLTDDAAPVVESSERHYGYTVRLVKRYNECKVHIVAQPADPTMGSCSIIIME